MNVFLAELLEKQQIFIREFVKLRTFMLDQISMMPRRATLAKPNHQCRLATSSALGKLLFVVLVNLTVIGEDVLDV